MPRWTPSTTCSFGTTAIYTSPSTSSALNASRDAYVSQFAAGLRAELRAPLLAHVAASTWPPTALVAVDAIDGNATWSIGEPALSACAFMAVQRVATRLLAEMPVKILLICSN